MIRTHEIRNDLIKYLRTAAINDLPSISEVPLTSKNVSKIDICQYVKNPNFPVKIEKVQPATIDRVAESLGVEPDALWAVFEVQTVSGMTNRGKPKILFERHYFSRLTSGRYDAIQPGISNPRAGGYQGGDREYERLAGAAKLDCNAALSSTSWGSFQVMGFNYNKVGYTDVHAFAKDMLTSEDKQVVAFGVFLKNVGLIDELVRKDWAGFARGYNGPAYRQNRYDQKMGAAYLARKGN